MKYNSHASHSLPFSPLPFPLPLSPSSHHRREVSSPHARHWLDATGWSQGESGGSQSSHHIITVWLLHFLLSLKVNGRQQWWEMERNSHHWSKSANRKALKKAKRSDPKGEKQKHACINIQIHTHLPKQIYQYICKHMSVTQHIIPAWPSTCWLCLKLASSSPWQCFWKIAPQILQNPQLVPQFSPTPVRQYV